MFKKSFFLQNPLKLQLLLLCTCFCNFSNASEGAFFNSNGVNIYYQDSGGDQLPVVLLHGYTMSSGMWYESGIADKLTQDLRVISIDLRGHGESDKPLTPDNYGPQLGLDVIRLLEHLDLTKAHMIGYSMGAFVVGRLLVTHPEKILSATLCSGYFPIKSEQEEEFNESTARAMESHGKQALASVARGWTDDAVTEEQVANISVPLRAVFGSEEINDYYYSQKSLLEKPKRALPVLIIEGADHDSNKAAVLHPAFLSAAKELINSTN